MKEEWEFAPGFNVFIGDNGAGKTAILDALTFILTSIFSTNDVSNRKFRLSDARCWTNTENDIAFLVNEFPVGVKCNILFGDKQRFVSRNIKRDKLFPDDGLRFMSTVDDNYLSFLALDEIYSINDLIGI